MDRTPQARLEFAMPLDRGVGEHPLPPTSGQNLLSDPDPPLLELLQDSLQRHAERIAVEGGHWILTYADLDRESLRLAARLRELGVRPGHQVPMLMGRSPRLVVAMAALVRCGATYVPIDMSSPPLRRAAMLGRLDSPIYLIDDATHSRAWPGHIAVDPLEPWMPSPTCIAGQGWPQPGADAAVYVMFTSGSTGVPKGVVVPQRGVARLVHRADYADFPPDARWAVMASPAFDASTLEIWGALLNGGCCVIQEIPLPSIDEIAAFLVERRITHAWLTSALFNTLVDDRLDALASLQQLATGGERVSPAHARRCLQRWPRLVLINGYGPTENTTFSLCHRIRLEDVATRDEVPIGVPIRATTARVMPANGGPGDAPCEPGQAGELWVGGAGVALGYLGQPDLDRSRFAVLDGDRWYRTGDIVRQRDDGVFEFIGRADRQVKIQGNRVELDEVERMLSACPGVGDAAIEVVGNSAGERHLVGFYSCPQASDPGQDTVRDWLTARLAPSAVPHALQRLDALPLTLNGKVDRTALLAGLAAVSGSGAGNASPVQWRTPTEDRLAGIWQRHIAKLPLHPDSHFLHCGGTSLMALRMASDIAQVFGRRVEPLDIVRYPVFRDLARIIEHAAPASAQLAHPAAASESHGAVLSRSQQMLVLASCLDASGAAYLSHVALVLDSAIAEDRLRAVFIELADRHPMLRTVVRIEGSRVDASLLAKLPPGWWQSLGTLDAVPTVLHWPEALLDRLNRPLDLECEGPMRVGLAHLPEGSSLLVWTVHHFAIDEASIHNALDELDRLLKGEQLAPALGSAFAFAAVERAATDRIAIAAHAAQVAATLRGKTPPLLPAPRPGSELAVPIDDVAARALGEACQRWGVTPFTPIVVAFGLAVQQVFGGEWRFVLTPFSRRTEVQTMQPIGYLVDLRLIEAGARPGETLAQTLARVHRALIEAQQPRFTPVDLLADAIEALEPGLRTAVTQFAITWRAQPEGPAVFGGHPATILHVPQAGARFGLTLHARTEGRELGARLEATAEAIADGRAAGLAGAFAQHLARVISVAELPTSKEALFGEFARAPNLPMAQRAICTPAVRRQVQDAWARCLGARPEDDGAHFLRSGGSSLLAMRVCASLRQATGRRLDVATFLRQPTLGRLCEMLGEQDAASPEELTIVGTLDFERLMLVLPGLRGSAVGMYRLAQALHASLPHPWSVGIVDLQAIMSEAPENGGLDFLVQRLEHIVHGIGAHRIGGVVGYSLGGLLGIDLLARLESPRVPSAPLWLVDTYAPRRMRQGRLATVEHGVVSLLRHPIESALRVRERLQRHAPDPAQAPGGTGGDAEGMRWRALLIEFAKRPVRAPGISATLIHSTVQARRAGLIRRRESNGFDPRDFGSFKRIPVAITHDALRGDAASDIAALIAAGVAH